MKFNILFLLLVFFTSCKTYKGTFINEYGDEVLYSEQYFCDIFNYHSPYKAYSPKKCFEIKYHFDKKSYKDLTKIYYKAAFDDKSEMSKKKIKELPFYKVSEAINNTDTLVNRKGFGLYYVSGKVFAPFFYFLRTETGIFFYKCYEKNMLIKELNNSKNIAKPLKRKIFLFINNKCKGKEGLRWFAGARFY